LLHFKDRLKTKKQQSQDEWKERIDKNRLLMKQLLNTRTVRKKRSEKHSWSNTYTAFTWRRKCSMKWKRVQVSKKHF